MKWMEIVAPGGQPESLKAAVLAGADAVYLGLKGLGARRLATNFTVDELIEYIDWAHLRGVRLYLTLNTLMTDEEIESVYDEVKRLYEAGLDGIIIQDLGVLKFIKTHFPGFHIHASTQMTCANHEEAEYLRSLGIHRLVPARELSIPELADLKKQTDIELEVFVSGALCVSYSGNCYLSSFIGGRSGNRGMCTQACRRPYENEHREMGYYLSPKDQVMGKPELEKLAEAGIDALKLEGRMKTAVYVYAAVKNIHRIMAGVKAENLMPRLFNRGYSRGYMYGAKDLINTRYASNHGVSIGECDGNWIKLSEPVITGDGLSFLDRNEKVLGGEYLSKIRIKGDPTIHKSARAGQVIQIPEMSGGTVYVYKTFDKALNDELEHDLKQVKRRLPITGELTAHTGKPLTLSFQYKNFEVTATGLTLEAASNRVLDGDDIREKVSELGDTTFELTALKLHYDEACFIPLKELKNLKREAAWQLAESLVKSYRRKDTHPFTPFHTEDTRAKDPIWAACVTEPWQEEICRNYGIEKIYYRGADAARQGNLDSIDLDSPMARNLYQLLKNRNSKVTLDWNFNITNSAAFSQYAQLPQVDTIYLSPELNLEQVALVKGTGAKKGLVIYGNLTGMYIETRIFPENYQEFTNDANDKFRAVINKFGNTEIYLYEPMNLIPRLDEILALGLDELRLDFQFETPEQIAQILQARNTRNTSYTPYNFDRGLM